MRVAVFVSVALLALPSAALAADRLVDPRGDADGGPDIVGVTLTHSDSTLAIAVDFDSVPPLGFDEGERYTDMMLIGIHTDDDLSRGDVEFATGVHGVDLTLAPVRSGNQGIVGAAEVTVTGPKVTLELERTLLGDPEEVAVEVAAAREYVAEEAARGGDGDAAPASGPHRYVLSGEDSSMWLWLAAAGLATGVLVAVVGLEARRHRLAVRR